MPNESDPNPVLEYQRTQDSSLVRIVWEFAFEFLVTWLTLLMCTIPIVLLACLAADCAAIWKVDIFQIALALTIPAVGYLCWRSSRQQASPGMREAIAAAVGAWAFLGCYLTWTAILFYFYSGVTFTHR